MSIKSVSPRTQLSEYLPNQEVNFDIYSENEALVPGSVFLTGRLVGVGFSLPNPAVNPPTYGLNFMDNYAGVSAMFENIIVRCDAYQEIISNYGRYAKINNAMTYSTDSLCAGLKQSCELLTPHINSSRSILVDATVGVGNPGFSFAHKWINSLNNMSGNLSFAKSGRIQLSFKLVPPSKCFFGEDIAAQSYKLTDLELHYMTSPTASQSVSINVVEDTQKLIQTSDTTIQNTFIQPISKLICTFANTTCETDPTQNALACQHPPIERLSWMYNDVSNQLQAFDVEKVEEMLLNGLSVMAMKGTGIDIREFQTQAVQNGQTNTQDKFVVGLNLGSFMNFSRSPVGLNVRLTPGVAGIYAYFYGFGQQVVM